MVFVGAGSIRTVGVGSNGGRIGGFEVWCKAVWWCLGEFLLGIKVFLGDI